MNPRLNAAIEYGPLAVFLVAYYLGNRYLDDIGAILAATAAIMVATVVALLVAWFVQRRSDKQIIPLPDRGYCYVHRMFSPADIMLLKERYPDAEVLVHPECDPEVQRIATHICSTSQMLLRAKASPAKRFIIATEVGLVERMKREFPGKEFIPALETAVCEQMKRHTLEKLYLALRDMKHVVQMPPEIAARARAATERMLEISGRATRD